jgi:hypothetical protein
MSLIYRIFGTMPMRSFLANPYPAPDPRLSHSALVSILLGGFVAVFLIVFKPFDTSESNIPNLNLFLSGYGLVAAVVTFLPNLLLRLLVPSALSEQHWTIGRQMLYLFVIISLGISASYAYLLLAGGRANWGDYFYFFRNGLLVASIPLVIITLLDYIRKLRYYESGAARFNAIPPSGKPRGSAALFELSDAQGRTELSIHPDELWCLHSDGNYVEVWFSQNEGGDYERKLIRNTLSELTEQLPSSANFLLCHRSWVVNADLVQSVSGNAQGYRLQREGAPVVIVARGRSKVVLQAIQREKNS